MQETPTRPWTSVLTECLQEYNSTTHSATQFSPEYLLTGKWPPIVPVELEVHRSLEEDRKEAFQNSQKQHKANKDRFDQHRRENDFRVGDLVYVERENKLNRNKLEPIRTGPHKILQRISGSIYELQIERSRRCKNFFHCNKLIPFSGAAGGDLVPSVGV
ncbi:hypothetical protein KPH14_011924 [Odynerus spinipes]|uniref:Tf2-1-like SH3-like domain-containing protein n=1 Tax=Odynerus spinipes TaxID=1348599 RepID=A0AAD9REP5_9HYME|nr:hypothetical protein KPH14_011924 [Odynerus spinipes]